MTRTMLAKTLAASAAAVALSFGLAGCSHGDAKPSQAEFKSGLVNSFLESDRMKQLNLHKDMVEKYVGCMADKSYDRLSVSALKALAAGKAESTKLDTKDSDALDDAMTDCSSSLSGK